MSNISEYYVGRHASAIETAVFYRCFFEAGGVGVTGLSLLLKITNPAGNNVSLTYGTTWTYAERSNIVGDYEIVISLLPAAAIFSSFGQYTIEIDSQDPGVGKLITHFTLNGVYCRVYPGTPAPTTTQFKVDLPSTTLDFYKDAYLLMLTGNCAGSGPKKVTGYATDKLITINALPIAPAEFDVAYLIRF